MQEKPKVVVSKTPRRAESAAKDFAFTQADIPAATGVIASYRARAWDAFKKQTLPDVTLEAWRRTDIHSLPTESFKLPVADAYKNLPPVPADLLRPLVADQHGGQVVLLPGGSKIDLDPSIAKQGVIFTDLKTAQ
ncbi:MAG TPA: hypothetical protein VHM28_02440, partial [Anaerolineales bacterium]|nr:hypothetical protein [Anaerolineales bacterium]